MERLDRWTPALSALKKINNNLNSDDCSALKSYQTERELVLLLTMLNLKQYSMVLTTGIEVSQSLTNEPARYYRVKVPDIISHMNRPPETPVKSALTSFFHVTGSVFLLSGVLNQCNHPYAISILRYGLLIATATGMFDFICRTISDAWCRQ